MSASVVNQRVTVVVQPRVTRIVNVAAGSPGRRGFSAYEIALQNGFVGTEEEWLESLEGFNANTFEHPLEYDRPNQVLRIAPPGSTDQLYRWNGLQWVPATVRDRRVEHRVITAAEAAAKEIQLAFTVNDPSKILFDVADGGGPQFPGSDYQLAAANRISWAGLSLDGIMAEGDRVRIAYE